MTMEGDYGLALANGGGIRPLSINSNATVWPRRYGESRERRSNGNDTPRNDDRYITVVQLHPLPLLVSGHASRTHDCEGANSQRTASQKPCCSERNIGGACW